MGREQRSPGARADNASHWRRPGIIGHVPEPEVDVEDAAVWLLPGEALALTGVRREMLLRWADAGLVVYRRTLGGHRRYQRASLIRAMQSGLEPRPRTVDVPERVPGQWLSLGQAAALAGVTLRTVRDWASTGIVVRRRTVRGVEVLRASVEVAVARVAANRERRRAGMPVSPAPEPATGPESTADEHGL